MDIENLFLLHYRPLCLYALRFLGNTDRAEDIVQDCFVGLLEQKNRDATEKQGTAMVAAPLLFRIVHNRCIDELRRNQQHLPTLPLDQLAEPNTDDIDDAFEAARLWTAIDALPSRCREAFLLSKRDGMKYREIARELGISERTVEHHVEKALRILRGKASDFFRLLFAIG